MRGFFQISKVDEEKRLVYGVMTSEALDTDNEVCDYDTTKPYIKAWSQQLAKASGGENLGNVRTMHNKQLAAVGKLVDLTCDDAAKTVEVCAYIADDQAWKNVTDRIYTGFSQGGRYIKRWPDPVKKGVMRYTLRPFEISLVDLPANPEATFTLVKAGGSTETLAFKIKARADVSEKDKENAGDGEFADEKNKKYKLNNEKQIRAAWSYINMPKNQAMYSAADVATIKKKIIAAWKAKIDPKGPPSASEKAAVGDALNDVRASILAEKFATSQEPALSRWRLLLADYISKTWAPLSAEKGLFTVGWFAQLLQQLSNLTCEIGYEETVEQDGSPMPETMKALLKELAKALEDYTCEEVDELLASIGNDPPGGTPAAATEGETKMTKTAEEIAAEAEALKAGARHSAADMAHLQAAHKAVKAAGDHLKALGATDDKDDEDEEEGEEGAANKKVAKLAGQVEDLGLKLAEAHEALKAATAEITRLNNSLRPTSGKAADISHLRVATKAADGVDGSAAGEGDEAAQLAADIKKYGGDPRKDPHAAMKKAQDKPYLISPQTVARRPNAA